MGQRCRHGHRQETGSLLSKINHVFSCEVTGVSSNNPSHLVDIEIYYNEIVSTLKVFSDIYIPQVQKSAKSVYFGMAFLAWSNL